MKIHSKVFLFNTERDVNTASQSLHVLRMQQLASNLPIHVPTGPALGDSSLAGGLDSMILQNQSIS